MGFRRKLAGAMAQLLKRSPNSKYEKVRPLAPIHNLPPELFLEIADWLPLCSAAALAVCSKAILYKMGHQYFDKLSREFTWQWLAINPLPPRNIANGQRRAFLLLLERDYGDLYFCHFCQYMHGLSKNAHGWDRICERPLLNTWKYGARPVNYSEIYMAMKRVRCGQDPTQLLQRISRTSKTFTAGVDISHEQSLEGRIVNDQFYLLTRHRFTGPSVFDLFHRDIHLWGICPHLGTKLILAPGERNLFSLDQTLYMQVKNGECTKHHGCRCVREHCFECLTDYSIDVEYPSKDSFVLTVNVYKNLGEIRTPFDPIWRAHFEDLDYSRPFCSWEERRPLDSYSPSQETVFSDECGEHLRKVFGTPIKHRIEVFRHSQKRLWDELGLLDMWTPWGCPRMLL